MTLDIYLFVNTYIFLILSYLSELYHSLPTITNLCELRSECLTCL